MIFWTIFSREFIEIIRDRRRLILMLVSIFIAMPLVFIVPYAVMLIRLLRQASDVVAIPVQGMENAPSLVAYLAEHEIQAVPAQDAAELVFQKKYPAGLIIPADYEERLASRQPVELRVVTDLRRSGDITHTRLTILLEQYGDGLLEQRLVEQGLPEDFITPLVVREENTASTTETAGSMLGMIIPGLVLAFGLSAGMPMAISVVAGEKKDLTLEPVLFTTVSRMLLVFAKYLAVVASILITLLMMTLGLLISGGIITLVFLRELLEKLREVAASAPEPNSTTQLLTGGYHVEPLAILLFLLAPLLIILMIAALQLMVSTWARNDDEASTYLTPLNYLSGAVVFVAFFLDQFVPKLWHYAIPVFGTILSMRDLLGNRIDPASLLVMFLSSAFLALVMLALAVWMFHREQVVFRT